MAIRLNQVVKKFNVGMSTIVEFLKKKGLGPIEENPNAKITDEQFEALRKEFSKDRDLADKKDIMLQNRQRKEKKLTISVEEPKEIETVIPEDKVPHVVGKIDLSTIGKPRLQKETDPAPKEEKVAVAQEVEQTPTPVVEVVAVEPAPEPQSQVVESTLEPEPAEGELKQNPAGVKT
ncbi:MAG: translation initiation factor IF-2, partial [Bacteroidaceae bacterium]|nr:translation initiation factor IF-2 [Bacteroidaceae bacterium]